jgi:uncharacterized coiled-coil DUF342 family protein
MSTSIDDASAKIENLKTEAFKAKEERDNLNATVKRLAEERGELLQKFHETITRGKEEKEKRDALRGQLSEQKVKLDALYKELEEKKSKVALLLQKTENTRGSGRARAGLEAKLRDLEWKYQTSILTPEQEKASVKAIDELTKMLNVWRKADQERDKLVEKNAEVGEVRNRIGALRDEMNSLRTLINGHHTSMSTFFDDATKLRGRIDEISAKIEEVKVVATQQHTRYLQLLAQTRPYADTIQQQIRADREERTKKMVEKQKVLTQEALAKYNNGKKLSLEEFQLLVENGYL